MPAFTIITVCLNIASTIRRTCESIVHQTFQDFQWIVVDGASTDGTLDILQEYSSRINILISEPDKGIYNAMNKGIKLATGEYINFMNGGDEFYDNNVLEKVYKTRMEADVVYGDEYIVGAKTYLLRNHRKLCKKSIYKKSIYHQSVFVKALIQKRIPFDESYTIAADYDFLTKLFISKKYVFRRIDLVISVFYLDGISSNQHNYLTLAHEQERIRSKYYCFIQRYKWDNNYKKRISDKISHYWMVITHPRYIAGYFKRKIINITNLGHRQKNA